MSKKSIFEVLYYGSVSPWENSRLYENKEYREKIKEVCDLEQRLDDILSDDGKKLFLEFQNTEKEANVYFEREKFKEGFILGARLMIETLTDDIL